MAFQPVDLQNYPSVAKELARYTAHPGGDAIRVISACYAAGLTLRHARWALEHRERLAPPGQLELF
jgi:hypothetical protein